MNADVEKAVESLDQSLEGALHPTEKNWHIVRQALRDQEAEIARHVKMLADCFRMSGADPDGNEDWRIAPDALRAVTDLRRDYDEVIDWKARAESLVIRLCEVTTRNDVLRRERDFERAKFDRAVKVLTGIHAVIYPKMFDVDGKRYAFNSPLVHEQLQALSDRIRAIPDEIDAMHDSAREG